MELLGYSLAFTNGNAYVGDFSQAFLASIADHISNGADEAFVSGAGTDRAVPHTVPETVYMMFQMTFAIMAPALIAGSAADRMNSMFVMLWSIIVYSPIAHWVWAPTGWISRLGMLDFAGAPSCTLMPAWLV